MVFFNATLVQLYQMKMCFWSVLKTKLDYLVVNLIRRA
jgi:hypothetical protein